MPISKFLNRYFQQFLSKESQSIDLSQQLYYNKSMLDDYLSNYIRSFDKLALAVSGGRDSMAMLAWFCNNVPKSKFFVITVSHNLRGEEGLRDRDFVVDYCKKEGIQCEVYEEDIPKFCKENNYTVEQGARIRRREIFADTVLSKRASRVVLAHHMQDQVESILMHVFRGSGIRGLKGMSLDDGVLLRPMLNVPREDIERYVGQNDVPYVDDSTNSEENYTRNKLRNQIMPLIRQAYGGVDGNIIRLSRLAKEVGDYLDKSSRNFEVKDGEVFIPIEALKGEHVIAAGTVVNAVDSITTRVDLTSKHIQLVISLADKESGASIALPFGLSAHKESAYVVLAVAKTIAYSGKIDGYGSYDLRDRTLVVSEEKRGRLRCDIDKLNGCEIRNRRAGDVFKRFKGGSKSLGDYFTDVKVPKRNRDNVVVLAKGADVYALPEYEIGDIVKIDETTQRVAYLDIIKK